MQHDHNDLRYHYLTASTRRARSTTRARLMRWLLAYALALAALLIAAA
jgi:hypothetical protein